MRSLEHFSKAQIPLRRCIRAQIKTSLPVKDKVVAQARTRDCYDEDGCYYCWEHGHRIGDCPHKHSHLEQGKISLVNDRARLADGSWIPNDPRGKSPKDRVEAHHAKKRQEQLFLSDYGSRLGIIPISLIPDYVPASTFTNRIYDPRDEIEQLKSQLALMERGNRSYVPQPPPLQQWSPPAAQPAVPAQIDAAGLMQQMAALMNQMSTPSSTVTNEATSQYAITRGNPQGNQNSDHTRNF